MVHNVLPEADFGPTRPDGAIPSEPFDRAR